MRRRTVESTARASRVTSRGAVMKRYEPCSSPLGFARSWHFSVSRDRASSGSPPARAQATGSVSRRVSANATSSSSLRVVTRCDQASQSLRKPMHASSESRGTRAWAFTHESRLSR